MPQIDFITFFPIIFFFLFFNFLCFLFLTLNLFKNIVISYKTNIRAFAFENKFNKLKFVYSKLNKILYIKSHNYSFLIFFTSYDNTCFFSIFIIFLILLAFFSHNPVFSLLYILISFLVLSAFILNLGLEFVTLLFLIIYIGAVMMLFLLVIMLFNLQQNIKNINYNKGSLFIYSLFFIFYTNLFEKLNY